MTLPFCSFPSVIDDCEINSLLTMGRWTGAGGLEDGFYAARNED